MKVAIIGTGLQGRRRAQALMQSKDELVIVADSQWEKAKLLAGEIGCQATTDWEELVKRSDIGAVIVCTPTNLHLPMCLAALEQGKHVLCEKPLARTPGEAEGIVKIAQENNLKLKCGFNLRHHPGVVQAKGWLAEGIIGEPKFIRCRYGTGGRPGYDKEWRADPKISGGGQLMDQGVHTLDLARCFLGDFDQVFGFLQTGFWGTPVEDNAFCFLRTETGQIASIHVSWMQWKNLFSLEIFGQDGYILVEGLGGSYGTERAILGRRDFLKPFAEEIVEFRGDDRSWYEEWQEFVAAINDNREPSASGYDGLAALKLAYAIYESAEKGCVVKLK